MLDARILDYVETHTKPPSEILSDLAAATRKSFTNSGMLSGAVEGRFLKLLVQISGAKRILEIGMYTGYSALSMAEALPEGGTVTTCELEPRHIEFALPFFRRSPHGKKIVIEEGPALETLERLNPGFDMAFIDADKENYPRYVEEAVRLVRPGGLVVVDNALWSGKVLNPQDAESKAIHQMNERCANDPRVENVLLTVRDGIQLMQRK